MTRKRRRKRRSLTMMFIPHGRDVISIKIPYAVIKTMLVLVCLGIVWLVHLVYSYSSIKADVAEMDKLRQVNEAQAREISKLAGVAEELQQRVKDVDELDAQVRQLLGLEATDEKQPSRSADIRIFRANETAYSSAAGLLAIDNGLANAAEVSYRFSLLTKELEDKVSDLAVLKKDVQRRLAYLEAIPNRWPVSGRITSLFGMRKSPFGRGQEFHDGLDIAARLGAPVYAAGKGVVTFAGYKSGYGRTVIIDHGNGYRTWYAHNSSIIVKEGQQVGKGQLISRVGNTGRSTGPHLHFMVETSKGLIDPKKVLSK